MSAMTASLPPTPYVKPRMRGWIHLWSFFASVAACAVLISVSAALVGGLAALATSIYSVALLGLFGTSALYHRRTWSTTRSRLVMRRLDHSMIFVFIAGTYTPMALLAMTPGASRWVLAVVWVGAVAGIALKVAWPTAPVWLGVPIYVALGWVAVFVLPELQHNAGVTALVLLLVGGVIYTLGAIMYATRWPNWWPRTFGFHEFFHAATVLAAVCHQIAIWFAVFA